MRLTKASIKSTVHKRFSLYLGQEGTPQSMAGSIASFASSLCCAGGRRYLEFLLEYAELGRHSYRLSSHWLLRMSQYSSTALARRQRSRVKIVQSEQIFFQSPELPGTLFEQTLTTEHAMMVHYQADV